MNGPTAFSPLRWLGTALYAAAWPALIFLLAGDGRWLEGWLFAVWFLALCATVIIWLYRNDPALLAERYRRPSSGGQRTWDQVWIYGVGLTYIAWVVLMPLDARRFSWTPPFPPWLKAFGGICLLASAFLFFRAFHDNTFLSPLVRIQPERKQRVVSTGVYAFVRHPMYLGACLMFVGAPLLLGSAVGLGLAALATFLMALRIVGEERLLQRELEGYAAYQKAVRYRLIPFVW
jgi:protein-S-isoprenylcysteine O-methyltransferase Ste14